MKLNNISYFLLINIIYIIGIKIIGITNLSIDTSTFTNVLIIFLLINFILYQVLDNKNDNKDNFTFELTPGKLCSGGPYMRSSSPEKQELCNSIPPEEIQRYTCPNNELNQPIYLERTPISDAKWQNNMCSNIGPGVPPQFDYMYS